jgi:hypothetical protein
LPLVMFTDGPFYGYGLIGAATDPGNGCLIVASAAVAEYTISGQPIVGLPTPLHIWEFWDNGSAVPCCPYIAFGDVAWAAYNGEDTTVVDSLIILYIFS